MSRFRRDDEDGFTLVELLVSMVILGIFFSIFTGLIAKLFDTTQSQQARSASANASRNIMLVLDRQVRYADGIYQPASAASGTQYVVFTSNSRQGVQTCHQWQVTPTGVMRWASWLPGATAPLKFSTVGTDIGRRGTADVFSLSDSGASIQTRQRLTVSFQAGAQSGRDGSATRVSFTALNTASAALPATLVCQEKNPS